MGLFRGGLPDGSSQDYGKMIGVVLHAILC